ncbi:MAG TPA: AraC family transcriptional regulator ligand-binding domain-containing protein, partial [Polyangiaceae bacterium]|nr:AraC family transcriptional regulator ligand-binding domain-containing protein [Polyangiaceae bacterium]
MTTFCSARLLKPFMRLATSRAEARAAVPSEFWSANPDSRVSLESAHGMLARGVELMRDDELGLRVGAAMHFGDGGAFDYALRSAATLRGSLNVATKYSGLLADRFRVTLERWHGRCVLRMDDEMDWPRAAGDFAVSAFYKTHLAGELPSAVGLECWFPYATPQNLELYERVLPGARLRFGAAFFGFVLDAQYEDLPLPGADAVLHTLHCQRLDALLTRLNTSRSLNHDVRHLLKQMLRVQTSPAAADVARELHVSQRTLARKLEREGTTFTQELDGARRELALALMRDAEVSLTELAFQLGF